MFCVYVYTLYIHISCSILFAGCKSLNKSQLKYIHIYIYIYIYINLYSFHIFLYGIRVVVNYLVIVVDLYYKYHLIPVSFISFTNKRIFLLNKISFK